MAGMFGRLFGNTQQSRWLASVEKIMNRRYGAEPEDMEWMVKPFLASGEWQEYTPEEFADKMEEDHFLVRFYDSQEEDDGTPLDEHKRRPDSKVQAKR